MKSNGAIVLFVALFAAPHLNVAWAGPPVDLLCAQGIAHYQAGRLQEAIPLLEQVVSQAPQHHAAGHYLGLALLKSGKVSEGRRVLSRVARQDQNNVRLLHDLGVAYLKEGNTVWAVRTLSRALELSAGDGRIRYHLGLALLQQGDNPAAVETLMEAAHSPEVDRSTVAAHLGLALFRDQQWELSRHYLSLAMKEDAHHAVARRLLRACYEAEGIPASWISAQLATGMVLDSNPLYEHERTAPTALGPTLSGSLVFRPLVTARHFLWGELAGARTFYFDAPGTDSAEKQAGDASPSDLRASGNYAHRFFWGEQPYHFSLGYTFGLTLLDGPPPLADEHHLFLEEHGGRLTMQRLTTDSGGVSQLQLSLRRLKYVDLARNNWSSELSLEHAMPLFEASVRLLGWLAVRHELAQTPDYDALAPSAGLGGAWRGPLSIVLGIRAAYEWRAFYRSADSLRWSVQRFDNNIAVAAEIDRVLWQDFRLRATYQRSQNLSSVVTFDYGRDLVSLSLIWSRP